MVGHLSDEERRTRLQEIAGIEISDHELAFAAITHPSYNQRSGPDVPTYQRLEYLGDAILGAAIGHLLYERLEGDEGLMTRARARLVRTDSLVALSERLELVPLLRLAPSAAQELAAGKAEKLKADLYEALVGLIFLEAGYDMAANFVVNSMKTTIEAVLREAEETGLIDPKSRLSELCQAIDAHPPEYRLVGKEGPDHDPLHRVIVLWSQQEPVFGQGKGIKEAQRVAAKVAIESWFEGGQQA
tara:strand:+ start:362 stop:1093 length:732 start_codon:yes stop_codon:yes gene_type:complete